MPKDKENNQEFEQRWQLSDFINFLTMTNGIVGYFVKLDTEAIK